jgi:transcriptional regulator with XRE-family HTH domain
MTLVELEFTVGERLAKARKHAGLTQDEMAEKLEVSHSTVAKWEIKVTIP